MNNRSQNNSRRHCMVVHAYYPIGEARVEREAKALLDRGFEVDVLCLRTPGEAPREQVDGVQVYRLPVQRHRGKGVLIQFLEYLEFFILVFFRLMVLQSRRRYGTVQVHNLPDFLVFSALGPKLSGAKLVLDLHDLMPEFYAASNKAGMSSWPVRLLIWQEQVSCWFADHVITVTELWRQTLIERGVPAQKVSVVMNVADDRIFQRAPASVPAPRAKGELRLIYHGTLAQRYGIDLILKAVARLREQIPGIYLTIHGRGDYLDDLVKLAKDQGLNGEVHFSTQYVPITELPRLIQQADIGIVPYRRNVFTDGILPTKLMEYVALGVPVIAARTPIIQAYFDETMVEYFSPEDVDELSAKILELYHDRPRREQLAMNADRFNQQYEWGKVAAGYAALVEQLNAARTPPAFARSN